MVLLHLIIIHINILINFYFCFLWYDGKRQKGKMSKEKNVENKNIESDQREWWCGCKSEGEGEEALYFDLLSFSLLLAFDICLISIFDIFIFDIFPFRYFSFLSFSIHSFLCSSLHTYLSHIYHSIWWVTRRVFSSLVNVKRGRGSLSIKNKEERNKPCW